MKISGIPESVYARALELMGNSYEPSEDWGARQEYDMRVGKRGWTDGELEKAIYEHMTTEGWSCDE